MWIDDDVLLECEKDLSLHVWVPDRTRVVLGSANKLERECHSDFCEEDGIEVLRRYGGGGAVVLHPGCLIISLGVWLKSYFDNKRYFCEINKAVIEALASYDSKLGSLYQDGLSDICYEGKKIAGTSLFRSRNYLLYQASILCEKKIPLINRYLKHPSKEPEYRKGQEHGSFVTDLESVLGYCDLQTLEKKTKEILFSCLKKRLSSDLIISQDQQRAHLFAKAGQKRGLVLPETVK